MTQTTNQVIEEIKNLEFCVFDLETTGGNHKNDKIIEIGLVKIRNLEVIEEKDFLIQPEMKIPEFIQKLTSINQEDVEGAPLIEDVIDEIIEFMGDSILVAHNTSFDIPFFNSVLRRLKKPELENKSMCTNLMTKYLIPNLMNSNLNYMCKIFSINHHKAHRALDDARASADLLIKYLNIFINKNIKKLNHLYYPRNRYELDRIHYKKEEANNDEILKKIKSIKSPYLLTIKGENGVIQFALPCVSTEEEIELIMSNLNSFEWTTTTIKLYGSFLESMVHFNSLFNKLDPTIRNTIMEFLWHRHLPGVKRPVYHGQSEDLKKNILPNDFPHFVITNHLVPEQMIIYPVSNLSQKQELVFRYPSHRKKLLQYINSKCSKLSSNKAWKSRMNPQLKEFLQFYLKEKSDHKNSLLFIDKKLPTKNSNDFFETMDRFLTDNPNPYNYPENYI